MDNQTIPRKNILAILLYWLVLLLGFFLVKYVAFTTGKEIVLKSAPVDPRDIFRGDYVILRYDISTISLDSIQSGNESYKGGNTIYVALEINDEGYGKAIAVSKKRIDNYTNLKGRIIHADKKKLNVKYGIESYFVKEGTGHEIEGNRANMYVRVVVGKSGQGIVKSLFFEDEE